MTDRPDITATEEAARLCLEVGRLLLRDGADTAQVQDAVARFASGLGYEARLIITYRALLLTIIIHGDFRTKVGRHIPAMNVNLASVEALNRIVDETAAGRLDMAAARGRLDALERPPVSYPRWLGAVSIGLTAACLSRLFGGDWPVFAAAVVAGTLTGVVRQQLALWRVNPLAVAFASALAGGVIGGLGMKLLPSATPALCLIAPGMILVPGVPLINGIRDAISNNMELSLARLAYSVLVVMAIAAGLFAATAATGIGIPLSAASPLLPVIEDALFSAMATVGYVCLFNVPTRLAWACILCGLCSHALRTALMHGGLGIVSGTLIASMAAGLLGHIFSRSFGAPLAAFAFPGVVAMVPGSYAFRAVIGAVQLMRSAGGSPAYLLPQTASLVITTVILTAAIAIGLAIPLILPLNISQGTQRAKSGL
jgi:uncharacterized membrane protein YjjP (DUF1212 family)